MSFTKRFPVFALISLVIIVAGAVTWLTGGANIGIDFTGGSIMTIELGGEFDTADVDAALAGNGITGAVVIKSGLTAGAQTQAVIRMQTFAGDDEENAARQGVVDTLVEKYPNVSVQGVDRVGAVASADLIKNCILSVVIAAVLILGYIWIRFELLSGLAAVICLAHDVAIMLALTCILRVQINSGFIAAILTIVGYSINNTIVVFDRVRELNGHALKHIKSYDRELTANQSIRGTLSRSINTSVTTLLTIVCVYLLGVDSIKEFCLPIIIGLVAGTYSSVFLAAPLWNLMKNPAKKKAKKA